MKPPEGQPAAGTPDFEEIKLACNGMLSPEVYREIYRRAGESTDGDLVEVGTAHGAATICLALAMGDSGRHIHSFERITGGSRERFGGIERNLAIIRGNFERYGVKDRVHLIVGDVRDKYAEVPGDRPLALLMLDADGSIDRDLALFYNRLQPGAPIIVDDCVDLVRIKYLQGRSVRVDLKHKLTHELVEYFVAAGMIERETLLGGTFFGRKPEQAEEVDFSRLDIVGQYRKLVFNEALLPSRTRERLREYLGRHPRLSRRLFAVRDWLRGRG